VLAVSTPTARSSPAVPARPVEEDAWDRIRNTTDISVLEQFRLAFPNGAHFAEVGKRIEQLEKALAVASTRRMVDDALNRYRVAFENKDFDGLKSVWPTLTRSELDSIGNFFRIAKSITVQLKPLAEPDVTADSARVRCRRTLSAAIDRGTLPSQDQMVDIRLRKSGNAMIIEAIDVVKQ
jgi:hypothetical protein